MGFHFWQWKKPWQENKLMKATLFFLVYQNWQAKSIKNWEKSKHTATLRSLNSNNNIRETAPSKFDSASEIVETLCVEFTVSIYQLRWARALLAFNSHWSFCLALLFFKLLCYCRSLKEKRNYGVAIFNCLKIVCEKRNCNREGKHIFKLLFFPFLFWLVPERVLRSLGLRNVFFYFHFLESSDLIYFYLFL